MTKIFIEPRFHLHPEYKKIYLKMLEAVQRFPEIKELGLSSFEDKTAKERKEQVPSRVHIGVELPTIYFNVRYSVTTNTIYHELQHVVHGMDKNKNLKTDKEEIEATLLGLARMPKNVAESKAMPYLGNVPKDKISLYGKFARFEKARGNRRWLKTTINKMATDAENEKYKGGWKGAEEKDKITKHKSENSESKVSKYLQINIKAKEQPKTPKEMFHPKNKGEWLYEKKDLIKVPSWMNKPIKKVKKHD
jgi:hypothetical protein